MSLNILEGFAPLADVAEDLDVSDRHLRRKINGPAAWPCLRWGGKIYLHIETTRSLIIAEHKSCNPARQERPTIRRRKAKGGSNGPTAAT